MRLRLLHARESFVVEVNASPCTGSDVRRQAAILLPDLHEPTMKLVVKGHLLKDSDDLSKVFVDGAVDNADGIIHVLVTGSTKQDLATLKKVEAASSTIRVRDDTESSAESALSYVNRSVFTHAAFLKHQREQALLKPHQRYGFGEVAVLRLLAGESTARETLEDIAMHPGVIAVMKAHHWYVPLLSEMPPDGAVGVDPVCVLGLNKNKGQEICLRLRTDDYRGFRKVDTVMMTLWHELAHNDLREHTRQFYDFVSTLTDEGAANDWRRTEGHSLDGTAGSGSARFTTGAATAHAALRGDDRVHLAPHTISAARADDAAAFLGGAGTIGASLGAFPAASTPAAATVRAEAARLRAMLVSSAAARAAHDGGEGTALETAAGPSSAAPVGVPSIVDDSSGAAPAECLSAPPLGAAARTAAHVPATASTAVDLRIDPITAQAAPAAPAPSAVAAAPTQAAEVDLRVAEMVELDSALSEAVAECLVSGVSVRTALTAMQGVLVKAASAAAAAAATAAPGARPVAAAATEGKYLQVNPENAAFVERTGGGTAVVALLRAAGFSSDAASGTVGKLTLSARDGPRCAAAAAAVSAALACL